MKTRIVLLGTGYVTVWTLKYLLRNISSKIKSGEVEVTFISQEPHHNFHGFTGEFLSGYIPLKFRSTDIKEQYPFVNVIEGSLKSINSTSNELSFDDYQTNQTQTINYDHLVIGIGSYDKQLFPEHISSLKKKNGIQETKQKILDALVMAQQSTDKKEIESLLTFSVIGAGLAGSEIAGNLIEYLKLLKKSYPVLQQHPFRVLLVHNGEHIIPQLKGTSVVLRNYAMRVLKKSGVEILLNSKVTSVTEYSMVLNQEQEVPSYVKIGTFGEQVLDIEGVSQKASEIDKRVVVDDYLRVEGITNVWAGGDTAKVRRPFTNMECNADALWAIKHGTRIGKNIAKTIKGKRLIKFNYPGLGKAACFGKYKAIVEMYRMPILGPLAWFTRIGFFLYFMPSKRKALNVLTALIRGNRDLIAETPYNKSTEEIKLTYDSSEKIMSN